MSTETSQTFLSVDVGIRNLGIAVLAVGERVDVIHLTCANLLTDAEKANRMTAQEVTERAELFLSEMLQHVPPIDVVLIENQPYRAGVGGGINMKLLAHGLVQFFRHLRQWVPRYEDAFRSVQLVHARSKLNIEYQQLGIPPLGEDLPSSTYHERKQPSVRLSAHILQHLATPEIQGVLHSAKKKDDLADALLQALFYICNNP